MNDAHYEAQNVKLTGSPCLPLIVVDSSVLKKLEAKFAHLHERSDGISSKTDHASRSPYSFLEFLEKDLGITLVFPRAVVREMLRRTDGLGQDVYAERTGPNCYRFGVNTSQDALDSNSAMFAALLESYQNHTMPDGSPGLRIYPSTDEMLVEEDGKRRGGIVIVDSGHEGPATTTGVRGQPFPGTQSGELAIHKMVKVARYHAHYGHPQFILLSDDNELRDTISRYTKERGVVAVGLRSLLKGLPNNPANIGQMRHTFTNIFDYAADPRFTEERSDFRWEKSRVEQWFETLRSQSAALEKSDSEKQEKEETPAIPAPPSQDASPTNHVDAAKPLTVTRLADRAAMGPPIQKPGGKPLKGAKGTGKLTPEEIRRRQEALRRVLKDGDNHANGR